MATGTAQGTRAARPQPQTTGEPAGGGFTRHSRKASRPGYAVSGSAFGANIDQPLSAAPGYMSALELTINASGGANATTNTVTGASNAPASDFGLNTSAGSSSARASGLGTSPAAVVQFIQVKDAYGTVVFSGPGYEMLYLVPGFCGQVGILSASDLNKWPLVSTAGLGTGTATANTGNFFYHTRVPFEIVPGYGCLAIGNASLQPQLHLQYQASGSLYATAPSTAPTIQTVVDEEFWSVPVNQPGLRPIGLGTTLQWIALQANPNVGSASSQRIQFPRLGGYVTTVILVARDVNGNRQDAVWPATGSNNRIRLYLDGVPVRDEQIDVRIDRMYEEFGGLWGSSNVLNVGLRPAGVLAYSLKASESQVNLGKLDSGDLWVSSTPGTLLEIECTPWGSFANGPATITAIVGQIVPRGSIAQGVNIQ